MRIMPAPAQYLLDGFVHIAGGYALAFGELDTLGVRAMGYYDPGRAALLLLPRFSVRNFRPLVLSRSH